MCKQTDTEVILDYVIKGGKFVWDGGLIGSGLRGSANKPSTAEAVAAAELISETIAPSIPINPQVVGIAFTLFMLVKNPGSFGNIFRNAKATAIAAVSSDKPLTFVDKFVSGNSRSPVVALGAVVEILLTEEGLQVIAIAFSLPVIFVMIKIYNKLKEHKLMTMYKEVLEKARAKESAKKILDAEKQSKPRQQLSLTEIELAKFERERKLRREIAKVINGEGAND